MCDIEGSWACQRMQKEDDMLATDGQDGIKAEMQMNREVASRGWVCKEERIHSHCDFTG